MKKVQKRLTLSRETVRRLDAPKKTNGTRKAGVELPTTTVLTRHITCTCL